MDIYNTGTPKYLTADMIFEGLCEAASGEEMGILGELFPDVSYDGQDYYYTDTAYKYKEKFESLTDYGDKMWLMDLAAFQVDRENVNQYRDIHDFVYEALWNTELAKKLGFKKLFVEHLLYGDATKYSEITEAYLEEAQELNCFGYQEMLGAYQRVMREYGYEIHGDPYRGFCNALYSKVVKMALPQEKQLVIESRALLNGYDDFIFGLRTNQTLHQELEQRYQCKVAELEAHYATKFEQLSKATENHSIMMGPEVIMLELAKGDKYYDEKM